LAIARVHTHGLPHQPRRTQWPPTTSSPTSVRKCKRNATASLYIWCGAPVVRLAATRARSSRRRVSVLFPGRRTADGRQAATPRDDWLRAGRPLAWRASARWLAGPSKGQGGVAESARPANNLPPMPMPVADPNNLPPVATLFKPLLTPPSPQEEPSFHKAKALLRSTALPRN
jgi:hypothetical protein